LLCKYCKEGASVVTHFWVPAQKKRRKEKKSIEKYNEKIIVVKRGCQSTPKMVKIWLRRLKNIKIEI